MYAFMYKDNICMHAFVYEDNLCMYLCMKICMHLFMCEDVWHNDYSQMCNLI